MKPLLLFTAAACVLLIAGCDSMVLGPSEVLDTAPVNTGGTIVVTNTDDSGPGSLRQAIGQAEPGDIITFDPSIAGQTITLATQLFVGSATSITIEGPEDQGMTISGGDQTRVITNSGELVLRNLTITGGRTDSDGAGIFNNGTLLLENSTVHANENIMPGVGAGITSVAGQLTVVNSTVSGNHSPNVIGGVYAWDGGTVTLIHTTIAFNSAGSSLVGGALTVFDVELTMVNTIIAHNTHPDGTRNCFLSTTDLALAGNLSDTDECGAGTIVANPLLGALADNGGPTMTHALAEASPAIDAGVDASVPIDQRYIPRPQGFAPDIGAFEFGGPFATVELTIDARQTVSRNTGVAVISGTLSCSEPAMVQLDVHLSQKQPQGPVKPTVHASETILVECPGFRFWSASLAPESGAFRNGEAIVSASAGAPPKLPFVEPASLTREVRLFWSH